MPKIAILGGGIAGLAAAWTIVQSGQAVPTLFEAAGRLGGVLETWRQGPYLIETAADNFATLVPDAWELSLACGLADDLIAPNPDGRQAFVLNRGRILPIPNGFSLMQPTRVAPILTTRALSWSAKLRLLGEFWVAKREDEADESLESFVTRRLGRETFENLVEPIISGIFTADPRTLSMAATMPQFLAMERKHGGLIRGHLAARRLDAAAAARKASGARYDQFVAPRQGMSAWVAGIADQLPTGCVQLNTTITRLKRFPSPSGSDASGDRSDEAGAIGEGARGAGLGWLVETASGERSSFDAVVCALPAAAAAKVLRACHGRLAEQVGDIRYASSAVAAMIVNKADLSGRIDGFGLIVPRKENRETLAISYSSNKYPGRVPDDEILLRIFFGGALRPELVDWPESKLLDLAATELREILGWKARVANWQGLIRWKEAMPQYLVGHTERITNMQQALADMPTLKLCGAAYEGVGIPQCVRGGRRAARELLETLAGRGSDPCAKGA